MFPHYLSGAFIFCKPSGRLFFSLFPPFFSGRLSFSLFPLNKITVVVLFFFPRKMLGQKDLTRDWLLVSPLEPILDGVQMGEWFPAFLRFLPSPLGVAWQSELPRIRMNANFQDLWLLIYFESSFIKIWHLTQIVPILQAPKIFWNFGFSPLQFSECASHTIPSSFKRQ